MNRRAAIIFYILSVYVIVQFIWWGFHLIELTQEVTSMNEMVSKRITMVIGEGVVFLTILVFGLWQIRKSIKKQLTLERKQKNFMLSVTHELKTPLAANRLYLQTLMKRELDSSKRNELLESAIRENTRLEQMIDNVLNAARLENNTVPINNETFDLKDLISNVAKRFISLTEKTINTEVENELYLNGDRFMFETILNNLVDNAIKYGGDKIEIYGKRDGDLILLGVSDNGQGVSKEIEREIFKKFFRGGDEDTRSNKGTGLGLFIISEIIRIHNSKIKYLNNESGGANFQITLNVHGN